MEKYGIIKKSAFAACSWPVEWQEQFNDLMRDGVQFKSLHYLNGSLATEEVVSQFDKTFNSQNEYSEWVQSSDMVPVLAIVTDISPLMEDPTRNRTATVNAANIDFMRNCMTLNVAIKTFDGGRVIDRQIKDIEINTALFGASMQQLQSKVSIVDVVKSVIKQKDAEGSI